MPCAPPDFSGTEHCTRADDETRTRDPNLGKVVRYQLRYIRVGPIVRGASMTLADR
ncbi:hypothetical protein MIC448_320019 [Microbacterium sp. C448]|nr:hypothetical protein MIC448_320019 [Microbacterium sp. C448]